MAGLNRDKLRGARQKLEKLYGRLEIHGEDPIEQALWMILLKHSTYDRASRALGALKREFVDFNELRIARPTDIAAQISDFVRGNGIDVADELRGFLRAIRETHHTVGFDFLTPMSLDERRRALAALPCFSPEVVLGVLLKFMEREKDEAFVADSHATKVAQKLGVISQKTTAVAFRKLLSEQIEEYKDRVGILLLLAAHSVHPDMQEGAKKKAAKKAQKTAPRTTKKKTVRRATKPRTTRARATKTTRKKSSRR